MKECENHAAKIETLESKKNNTLRPVAIHPSPLCDICFLFTVLGVEFTCFCFGNQNYFKHAWSMAVRLLAAPSGGMSFPVPSVKSASPVQISAP